MSGKAVSALIILAKFSTVSEALVLAVVAVLLYYFLRGDTSRKSRQTTCTRTSCSSSSC